MAVGASLANCQMYLKIDEQMYLADNAQSALDFCFKSFHALHAKYPVEAEQVWLVIQKGLYQLHTEWDKNLSGVYDLLTDIENHSL